MSQDSVLISLIIELRPRSVEYRRYLQPVGGRTFLGYCLQQIARSVGDGQFVVVTFDSREIERLKEIARPFPCGIFVANSCTDLSAICEVMDSFSAGAIAVVTLEYALAPSDLLTRVIRHHRKSGNDFTSVTGITENVGPLIFTYSFARQLTLLDLPGTTATCRACARFLRSLASTGVTDLQFRSEPLDFNRSYSLPPEPLPLSVSLEYPHEIALLNEAVQDLAAGPGVDQPASAMLSTLQRRVVQAQTENDPKPLQRNWVPHYDETARRTPRVLYLSNAAAFSGAEESLCQLTRHISSNCFDKFALVSLEGILTRRLREAHVNVTLSNRDLSDSTIENVCYLLDILSDLQPDLIHINGLDGFPSILAPHLMGIPTVMHVRNGITEEYREYARYAAKIIAVSQYLKRSLLSLDIEAEKIEVIYDELDPSITLKGTHDRTECRSILGVPCDSLLVTMIARLVPYKRHDLLLRAFAELRTKIPSIHLLLNGEVYGQSSYAESLERLIVELGIRDSVTRVPFVEDIKQVLSAADVLVLCSSGEGLGRCVVEAMAMEVPVIVTGSGGTCEIVIDGQTGTVIEGKDHHELADAITRIVTNRSATSKYTLAARRFVVDHLTAARSARAVETIYHQLLSNRVGAPVTQK